jgi:aldehyde dehydrogenase (NAD+)
MVRGLRVGTVWVNAYRLVSFDVPFGGVKQSGYGRENGPEGLRAYQQSKTVWIEMSGQVRDPFKLG